MASRFFNLFSKYNRNYKVVALTGDLLQQSKLDIAQNPNYDDFAFKLLSGKHKGIMFRLVNLNMLENTEDERLKIISVIKIIRIPIQLQSHKKQYDDVESEFYKEFYDRFAVPVIQDFIRDAYDYGMSDVTHH